MNTHYEVRGQVAVINLDFPPVNSIGANFRASLQAALQRAVADDKVRAIVVTGTPAAFSAGANVKEFGTPAATREPRLAALIDAFEQSAKPIIAAVSGICMGGGLELALGAHYRVAQADAQISLPEVKLGLMPGAGGTQRLPRAIGIKDAIDLIVAGESTPAERFRDTELWDAVTNSDPVPTAVLLAERVIAESLPLKRLRDVQVDPEAARAALQAARERIAATAGRFPAPMMCVNAVSWCVDRDFDVALQAERDAFAALMATPESRALRHAFGALRAAAKIPGVDDDVAPREIHEVGVIGAGTMGVGITMALVNAGMSVVLLETSQAALDCGLGTIRSNYEASARKGKMTEAQVEERMARITPTLAYADLGDVDLVIEAVFEDIGVKESVFRQLDEVCKAGTILASNTSFLDVNQIASFTKRPQDVLGLHFFSPAHVMRLLEIVRGEKTSPHLLVSCMALARRLGKVGIVAGVCDGFIGNRMSFRYTRSAFDLVAQGASPQQVDQALQAFGMAMGPLRMGDLAGLDIGWATRKRKAAETGLSWPVVPDKLCEAGRFGQKTGAGWYRYEKGQREPLLDPAVNPLIDAFRREQGSLPRTVSEQEIVERCIFALVNEGARILEEGIAARAGDIDLVYLNGYGFPAHRGGPMLYADLIGLQHVVDTLQQFASAPGADPAWAPAPLLLKLASEGRTFN